MRCSIFIIKIKKFLIDHRFAKNTNRGQNINVEDGQRNAVVGRVDEINV